MVSMGNGRTMKPTSEKVIKDICGPLYRLLEDDYKKRNLCLYRIRANDGKCDARGCSVLNDLKGGNSRIRGKNGDFGHGGPSDSRSPGRLED